ncbi:MAG: D-alanyl-D-alanine carboxypeptidase [Panacagrimonas sp.]|jgi:D-alanyl-D-alanine carboxypeptidase (penicillin-binding protein 5/6)|nr:D-alanyl-D-alanine carboxypeptidase family protein [Panacagrimonas sp.]MCC2655241.1 D-alanyl-D-alanine carboxypeptidase [Panacagrimonas sp.]
MNFKPLALLLAFFFAAPAFAASKIPDPPSIDARSWVLMDYASGEILAEKNADARAEPASITKVLLSYIVYDEVKKGRIKWNDEVLISEKAWRQGKDSSESRMFLNIGSKVALEDLVHGIVIQSGNDASVAVAEHLAGSEDAFAELMNQYAQKLGMKNSHFANAPGLPDPDHYSTARDLAILGRALIRDFPEEYKVYAQREFVYNGIKQGNRNILLDMDRGADGIKTGHTSSAGYCLLSSIKREDRRLISAVMGTPSMKYRAQASLELMNWGFRFFENAAMFGPDKPLATVRVWKGAESQLPVGAPAMSLLLPRGAKDQLQVKTQVNEPVLAPVKLNQQLGTIEVSSDGKVVRKVPLVALKEVPAGSLFQRLSDQVRMWIAD